MHNYEKLGLFYLGKIVNPSTNQLTNEPLLYESKNLTTHAVCVGMTGSGKTGLGIGLVEEAGMDKIPSIVIDPKGDLTNLLLTFPDLSPEEFLPWIDRDEAERKGMNSQEYAEAMSNTWREGLKKWDDDAERIRNLKKNVEMVIYTPASKAGVPLSILSSFAAPSKELLLDTASLRDRIMTTASGLLGLIGIKADPIQSREHILISTLLEQAWQEGKNIDIATLIQQVQKPPFNKIGALDIDTFFPAKDRLALSINLNNLLASPGFQSWMIGEPLDIGKLLYSESGKPKVSILSIAHLADTERMFFLTLLLNEVISWMRKQPGTSSLRALLYMDEIFGYFPPSAMPPSKIPMLTLLKQARAFGLGIVLATQNPVDLDYKGLANCGTWFIGKLQTERDKLRVIEGLKGGSVGEFNAADFDQFLSRTGNRTFILRSVYDRKPLLFQTRWTLSYLRGPLTLSQIEKLMKKYKEDEDLTPQSEKHEPLSVPKEIKPAAPSGIEEYFYQKTHASLPIQYQPKILGIAKLHFVDSKNKIDVWQEVSILSPVNKDGKEVFWDEENIIPGLKNQLSTVQQPQSAFSDIPAGLMQDKNYSNFSKSLANFLYQNQTYSLFSAPDLNLVSKDEESEGEFKGRVTLALREKRDAQIKKIEEKYQDKLKSLSEKLRKAQEKVEQKQQSKGIRWMEAILSFGSTILAAILGRKISRETITQTGTTMRRAGRISKDAQDAKQAEEDQRAVEQLMNEAQGQLRKEIENLKSASENGVKIVAITIHPRKSDISVEKIALVWSAG